MSFVRPQEKGQSNDQLKIGQSSRLNKYVVSKVNQLLDPPLPPSVLSTLAHYPGVTILKVTVTIHTGWMTSIHPWSAELELKEINSPIDL